MIDPRDRSFATFRALAMCAVALLLGVVVGFIVSEPAPTSTTESQQLYTCTMHPDVHLPDPDALCPICSMALVPAVEQADAGSLETAFSEDAQKTPQPAG